MMGYNKNSKKPFENKLLLKLSFRQDPVDSLAQFVQLKRFANHQIYTPRAFLQLGQLVSVSRNHNNRQIRAKLFQFDGKNIAFHDGHEIIEKDDIKDLLLAEGEGFRAAGHTLNPTLIKLEHSTDGI